MSLLGDRTEVFADFLPRQQNVDSPITDIEHGRRKILAEKRIESSSDSSWENAIVLSAYLHDIALALPQVAKKPRYSDVIERTNQNFVLYIPNKTTHADLSPENIIISFSDDQTDLSDVLSFGIPVSPQRISDTDYASTKKRPDISSEINSIFDEAEPEEFEDGMQNPFAERLLNKVREYGDYAIVEICHIILNEKSNPECAAEALKWLGNMDHNTTYKYRQWLLTSALNKCNSPIVRDGANLGLAFMDDPATIPYLEKAINSEASPLLRKLMKQTFDQLENTRKCLSILE
jgi:hypothetical protein